MKKCFILLLTMVVFVSCMKTPAKQEKITKKQMPDNWKISKIDKLKMELAVPKNWVMFEKNNQNLTYIFTNISNPDEQRSLDAYSIDNGNYYKGMAISVIDGQNFNNTDIELLKAMYPKVLNEENFQLGKFKGQKILLSNESSYLQLYVLNDAYNKALRLEFRYPKDNEEKNKKIISFIMNSIKINKDYF